MPLLVLGVCRVRDAREVASSRRLEPARHLGQAVSRPEPEAHPDGRAEAQQACCRALAQRVWLSERQAWRGAQRGQPVPVLALPQAQAVPQGPLKEARLRAAEESAQPDVPRAGPEAAVSVRAAAEPQPEAASVPWAQPVVAEAAEVPDESEPAGAAASDVRARQPAGVLRADAAVLLSAAARSGVREPQAAAEAALWDARRAAVPLALPSEAASVFRQGPSLAGPARARAARFAHVMRSLRIASRSEPSWRAARNENWS